MRTFSKFVFNMNNNVVVYNVNCDHEKSAGSLINCSEAQYIVQFLKKIPLHLITIKNTAVICYYKGK